ncbi:glycosyltransferase family 2 protein [Flavobacterium gilvum]|uniref:Glycosyl transferase family 2 n=1 Tax=Flavobacterium gilvum TaxID=1492737 RepID=A0AAC9I5Q3_9FLAO|nr:glycosyltransferase family 2 protein [Flavobacterium gilvum]AOW10924.1 glycosyl transferase family 2 [Flavobacterium gilvum]KFC57931.1 glycosyl transferase family 2 [Flavobacterium gilvum]
MFDIAIILINYNSSKHTINCIRSIVDNTSEKINYQIIITDNCSRKEDYFSLKTFCETISIPNLKLYRSNINTGFGGGNMNGVQHSNAKYYAFINNDTLLLNDCLSILKDTLDNNPEIGLAGGQSHKENGDFMVSLDHFTSPLKEIAGRDFLEFINPKKYPKRKIRHLTPTQVSFVPGSFMFLRAEDFNRIGGFDTNIFLYYEETDLCLRLKKISKHACLVPDAKFIHLHGASTEQKSIDIKKEIKISLLYVIRKHYGFFGHKIILVHQIVKYFFSSLFKPKNWSLFILILGGAHISKSLKSKQTITTLE